MRDSILYAVVFGFASGIFFRSLFVYPYSAIGVASLFAISFMALGVVRPAIRLPLILVSIALFAFSLGVIRFEIASSVEASSALQAKVTQKVILEGVVLSEPDRRESSTRVTLLPDTLFGERLQSEEMVLVSYPQFPRLVYGDRVKVEGVLQEPENFDTDTGRTFDYVSYLKKDGIVYQISFATVEKIGAGEGNVVIATLLTLKSKYLESIARIIPEPEVSLLGGITVGAKESLGTELTEMFREVGLIHIVVLSGYNISIVAENIMRVVSAGGYLPQAASLSIGAISIVLFALMTGASATVVRASLMALLVVLARATGRTYAITKALLIAGVVMVLHSPYILVFDPSFQLSFIATLGLILLGPHIEKQLLFVPESFGFRGFTVATIATQVFVLPLLLYQSGTLSLVSLPANLLVLVVVPFAMLFGFLAGVAGFLSVFLAYPFALVAHALLAYILFITELLSSVPFASVSVPYFPAWLLFALYVTLAFAVWRLSVRK